MPKNAFSETKPEKKQLNIALILGIALATIVVLGVVIYFIFFNKPASPSIPPNPDTTKESQEETLEEESKEEEAHIFIQEWGIQLKYPPKYGTSFSIVKTDEHTHSVIVGDYQVGVNLVKKTSSDQTISGTTIITSDMDGSVFVITTTTTDHLISKGIIKKEDEEKVKKIQDELVEFYTESQGPISSL